MNKFSPQPVTAPTKGFDSRDQAMNALRAAHDAGDTESAQSIADFVRELDASGEGKSMGVAEMAGQALFNLPSSAMQFVSDATYPFRHPIDTAKSIHELGEGIFELAVPGSQGLEESAETVKAVGQFYADRYGGFEKAKRTIASDPVGFMADLSTFLTGGATLAPKLGKMATLPGVVGDAVGAGMQVAADAVNPVNVAGRVGKGAAFVGTEMAALPSGLGGDNVRKAFQAGRVGGDMNATFRGYMKGELPIEDVVKVSKQAVAKMRKDRNDLYRRQKEKMGGNENILGFQGIDNAVQEVFDVGMFKEWATDASANAAKQSIIEVIERFKQMDPLDYHTVEGFDALKQSIDDLRMTDVAKPGTTSALVVKRVRDAIKAEIEKYDPGYAEMMKNYSEASELLTDIESTLSLGPKANVDTSVRKLQKALRNNVNTTYGRTKQLVEALEEAGAKNLTAAIAGQSASAGGPRGIGPIAVVGAGAEMASRQGLDAIPGLTGLAAASSPRVIGDVANRAGQAVGAAGDILGAKGIKGAPAAVNNALEQILTMSKGVDPARSAVMSQQVGRQASQKEKLLEQYLNSIYQEQ